MASQSKRRPREQQQSLAAPRTSIPALPRATIVALTSRLQMTLARGELFRIAVSRWFLSEHGDDVVGGNDKQLVVGFEIDWDRILWVEQDLVELPQGHVVVMGDRCRDSYDSAGDRWDLGGVGQSNASLCFAFRIVLPN